MALFHGAPAAEPQAVADLTAEYQSAMERSAREITEIYKNRLLEMKQKYVAAGDNASIAAVTNELTRIGVTSPVLAQTAGEKPAAATEPAPPDGLGEERFFAGRSWMSGPKAEFHFNRDGTGWRKDELGIKLPLKWEKMKSGIVHATGSLVQGGASRDWYFMFNNRKTALYGLSPDSMPSPLEAD